jgi:hypothetical protein
MKRINTQTIFLPVAECCLEETRCRAHLAVGSLYRAAETVIENWENGDLAYAVRELRKAMKLCVKPIQRGGKQ